MLSKDFNNSSITIFCFQVEMRQQCLKLLRFWINSIVIHTMHFLEGSHNIEVASWVLVGTRRDRVSSPADHESISTILYDTFSSNPAWSAIVENREAEGRNGRSDLWFFPVDNTKGIKDPTLIKLMQNM